VGGPVTPTPLAAWRIPLRGRFRDLRSREGILLEGPAGHGEFSPFADYSPQQAARWLAAAREAAFGKWPPARRALVPVNVTVPEIAPEDARALVLASGCTVAKVKVGTSEDEARLEAVRDGLGPGGRIRIDGNAGWTAEEAVRRIRVLERYGLEYVEQPVATLEEMSAVRRRVPVPLAADEVLRKAADPLRVDLREAADVAVLKVHPLGGVGAALRVADACGLPVVVSSALETSIGLAAGVALAAALPELPFACGLGTAALLAADLTDHPLLPSKGALEVRRPALSPRRLAAVAVNGAPHFPPLRLLRAAEAEAAAPS
jgi:O-succinylbenzoate synthase